MWPLKRWSAAGVGADGVAGVPGVEPAGGVVPGAVVPGVVVPEPLPDGVPVPAGGVVEGVVGDGVDAAGAEPVSVVVVPEAVGALSPPPPHAATSAEAAISETILFF